MPADILVNDAGIGQFALLAEMTEEQWDRMIAVHLKGTFNCTRALVPDMIQAGWGRVVNIASVAGLSGGGPGLSHYAAAKGGIVAFTKALAHELGPSGITVNAIAPGLIDTPMIRQGIVSDDIFEVAVRGAPVRRIGAPDDIAAACAYLVSDESRLLHRPGDEPERRSLHVTGARRYRPATQASAAVTNSRARSTSLSASLSARSISAARRAYASTIHR